jgi:hypothetical protein
VKREGKEKKISSFSFFGSGPQAPGQTITMLLPLPYLRFGCVRIGKKVRICLESSERRVFYFSVFIYLGHP